MSFVDKVEARSSVELVDSCNCTECCPRTCSCWPRRVKKVAHKRPERQDERIDITATGIKVHTTSEPVLTASGHWDVEIDGVKQNVSAPQLTTEKKE